MMEQSENDEKLGPVSMSEMIKDKGPIFLNRFIINQADTKSGT